jgi:hypothetical protein
MLVPVLRIGAVDRLRVLAHPPVALPLWLLNLYVWHLPALYRGRLTSEPLHALQHRQAARHADQRQELLELAEAHGIQVDEARVRRAVNAGRGEGLEAWSEWPQS